MGRKEGRKEFYRFGKWEDEKKGWKEGKEGKKERG